MTKFTMIRRIWLGSGIRRALLCCTDSELRAIVTQCEEYLPLLNRGIKDTEERRELEDWRRIVLGELLKRQILAMRQDRGLS